ncbi:hypothetical protein Tco_1361809 [Tanacetum coccineum]
MSSWCLVAGVTQLITLNSGTTTRQNLATNFGNTSATCHHQNTTSSVSCSLLRTSDDAFKQGRTLSGDPRKGRALGINSPSLPIPLRTAFATSGLSARRLVLGMRT